LGVKIACRDVDPTISCPFVAEGATIEEATAKLVEHAKVVHKYTDEQLSDPKTMEAVKKAAKIE
jgi:predicted small metal-binding protein